MLLKSTAFVDGAAIPRRFTCEGEDVSPALSWSDAPGGTRSFAVLCDDPDAPAGVWHHWAENQFSKALEFVTDALPQALLINGQNPLTLLHAALNGGLHNQTDEECLGLAHAVRVVLVELAERLGQAMKDDKEIKDAIARLTSPKGEA